MTVCEGSECGFGQQSPEGVFTLWDMGFSLLLYATDFALRPILVLTSAAVAFVILWRRSREWLALLISLSLITFATNNEVSLALTGR